MQKKREIEGVHKTMLGLARETQDYGKHVIDSALFMIVIESQLYNTIKRDKIFKSFVELSNRKNEFLTIIENPTG